MTHGRQRVTRERRERIREARAAASDRSLHWLGEGRAGQEALLLDLAPIGFFLDQVVATRAASVAHSSEASKEDAERPFAAIVPPDATIGWQLGHLSKYFNVYVSTQGDGEFVDEAASYFSAQVVGSDFDTEIEHFIDFFLLANPFWRDANDFRFWLSQLAPLLSDSGVLCSLLPCFHDSAGRLNVSWLDGTSSGFLSDFPGMERSLRLESHHVERLSKTAAHDSERLSSFLKRNREFFGKNIKDSILQRIADQDFCADLQVEGSGALFVCWSRIPEESS